MNKIMLTVTFEGPFWVGIFEQEQNGHYQAAKIIFGAEPSDMEIYRHIQTFPHTISFTREIYLSYRPSPVLKNPKRRHREARRALAMRTACTKAQAVIQQQRSAQKIERKTRSSAEKEAAQKRKYQLKQMKRKEKRKGH